MKTFIYILAAVAVASIAILVYIAIQGHNAATFYKNFAATAEARAARHKPKTAKNDEQAKETATNSEAEGSSEEGTADTDKVLA